MESSLELLRTGTVCPSLALDISVEPHRTSALPILCVVGVYPGAVGEAAKEGMLRRIDHDSDVPAPNHQVSRLRVLYPPELIGALVEVGRTRIRIREAGPVIDCMHQMRTIILAADMRSEERRVGKECRSR